MKLSGALETRGVGGRGGRRVREEGRGENMADEGSCVRMARAGQLIVLRESRKRGEGGCCRDPEPLE